ncbi:hypothetical protein WG66_000834 [Moniliophthora roreri]|uniref:DUF6533 domain-containing protein n=1 Tax=Moniliophthora roreri TaxID=221103 RepID=A0A0W0G544_MONRR|nr:hypothetical protein WG66_000834 [Moniliophthora roreri]
MASKAESAAVTHYLQFYIQWASISTNTTTLPPAVPESTDDLRSATAVLWYDYALTFPMEVKYMWGTKPRLSTALYICCRHALITNILYLLAVAKLLGDTRAPAGFLQRLLNAVLLPLSTLLTARFLLHLRHWEHKQDEHKSTATRTMGSFRAAPGVLSTIIEEFGDDPVAVASSSKQAAARQRAEGVHVSQDRPSRFEF